MELGHDLLAVCRRQTNGREVAIAKRVHIDPHPLVRIVVRTDILNEVCDFFDVLRRASAGRRIGIVRIDVAGRRYSAAKLVAVPVVCKLALRRRAELAIRHGRQRRRRREHAVGRRIEIGDYREPPLRHLVIAQPIRVQVVA